MKNPVISVVIPTYNSADTILDTVQSVLAQSFEDFELLIVDDCSQDDLQHALSAVNDARIKLIHHSQNKGAAAARNTGILAAKGEYVALIDSDDVWMPGKLEKQLAYMRQYAETKILASCTSFSLRRLIQNRKRDRILDATDDWESNLLDGCTVSPGSTFMAQRKVFESNKIGLYDPDLRRLEDWDWLLRYMTRYELGIVEEKLSEVRLSGYPNYQTVRQSADILSKTRLKDVRAHFGDKGVRQVRAGLEVEKGTSAYRQRKYFTALYHFVAVGFISIKRLLQLLTRMLEKLCTGDHSGQISLRNN